MDFLLSYKFASEERLLELQASVTRLEADLATQRDRNRVLACDLQEAEGAVEGKDVALRGKHEQMEVLKVRKHHAQGFPFEIVTYSFLLTLSVPSDQMSSC